MHYLQSATLVRFLSTHPTLRTPFLLFLQEVAQGVRDSTALLEALPTDPAELDFRYRKWILALAKSEL